LELELMSAGLTLALRILLGVALVGAAACSFIGQRRYFRTKRSTGLRRWYHDEHRRTSPALYYGTFVFLGISLATIVGLQLAP
jgi:hypothetical protein